MNRLLIILTLILILIILIFCELAKAETYRISFYCACKKCCGKNAKGVTASGLRVRQGMVAVDPHVISLKSIVKIEGMGKFLAADTGSAIKGKRIDVFCENHKLALQKGVQYRNVKLISRGGKE